jgi:type II secretory pathway component PulF
MSMAALTQGGMSQMEAIDRLRPNSNRYVRYRLDRVRIHMLNGYNFGAALHRTGLGWPDRKMNLQIKVYAETHDLSAQLGTLAKTWVDQAQLRIEKAMAGFKGFAMIVVFFGIFTVIGGMYALQDQIGLNAQMNAW